MKILALEFSSPERGVALLEGNQVMACEYDLTVRGTKTFEIIRRVLDCAKLRANEIDCVAVGLGPGSYGGIRSAIAVAQGWQMAHGTPLAGISSAEAIAHQVNTSEGLKVLNRTAPFCGVANIVFDAQRNEAYAIRYVLSFGAARALGGFELLTSQSETNRRDRGESFIKADRGPWRLGLEPVLFPDAGVVGALALENKHFRIGNQLEPIYLRPTEFLKAPPARIAFD